MRLHKRSSRLIVSFFVLLTGLCAQSHPPLTDTGTPLPAYRAFFRHIQFLEDSAHSASGAEASELSGWYQQHVGLTAAEAGQLKGIAASHVAAIEAIEKQAGQLIQAQHAQSNGGRLPSKNANPPVSGDLLKLQQQRDDLTLTHVNSVRSALSPGSFAKVDSFVKTTFKNQQMRTEQPGSQPKP